MLAFDLTAANATINATNAACFRCEKSFGMFFPADPANSGDLFLRYQRHANSGSGQPFTHVIVNETCG